MGLFDAIKKPNNKGGALEPQPSIKGSSDINGADSSDKSSNPLQAVVESAESKVNADNSDIQKDKRVLLYLRNESEPTFYGNDDDIMYFGFSCQGSSHKLRNIKCQDKCLIKNIDNNLVVALIADGLGSCDSSDEGAAVAICTAYQSIKKALINNKNIPDGEVISVLKEAMNVAFECVNAHASQERGDINDYYSTLTIVVYNGKDAFIAHAGDDGVVVINDKGICGLVTTRHKGETVNSVVPLQGESNWEFLIIRDIVGLVMATDGVLDSFVRREKENNRVFFPFIEMITQPSKYDEKEMLSIYKELLKTEAMQQIVSDDITFVAMLNKKQISLTEFQQFDLKEWFKMNREREIAIFKALYPDEELNEGTIKSWIDKDKIILKEIRKIQERKTER